MVNEGRGNFNKYLSFKFAFSQIKKGITGEFYIEAIAIEESIMSDRLVSFLLAKTELKKTKHHEWPLFGDLIKRFKKAIAEKKNGVPIDEGLVEKIDDWRKDRNKVIHSVAKSDPGTPTMPVEEFNEFARKTAVKGLGLVNKLKGWHAKEVNHDKNKRKLLAGILFAFVLSVDSTAYSLTFGDLLQKGLEEFQKGKSANTPKEGKESTGRENKNVTNERNPSGQIMGDSERLYGISEPNSNEGKEAIRHYELGRSHLQSEKADDAYAEFLEALRIKPDFAEAHLGSARALGRLGKHEQARSEVKIALLGLQSMVANNPNNADAHFNLGVAFHRLEDIKALEEFNKAIDLNPDHAEAHTGLAYFWYKRESYAEGVKEAKKAIRINPDIFRPYIILGMLSSWLGRNEEAIVAYKEALRIKPGDPRVEKLLAERAEFPQTKIAKEEMKKKIEEHIYLAKMRGRIGDDLGYDKLESKRAEFDKALQEYKEAERKSLLLRQAREDHDWRNLGAEINALMRKIKEVDHRMQMVSGIKAKIVEADNTADINVRVGILNGLYREQHCRDSKDSLCAEIARKLSVAEEIKSRETRKIDDKGLDFVSTAEGKLNLSYRRYLRVKKCYELRKGYQAVFINGSSGI